MRQQNYLENAMNYIAFSVSDTYSKGFTSGISSKSFFYFVIQQYGQN